MVRRTNTATRARFTPRKVAEPEGAASDAASIVGAPAPKSERVTDRRRQVAGDLPAWDLLPPGELTVRRI
jgi:hypothetical protein